MAKGSIAKAEVMKEILQLFGDAAFMSPDGKELRIEKKEDGEIVQIKVALTCAKVNIDRPVSDVGNVSTSTPSAFKPSNPETNTKEPTDEEKQLVVDMLAKLGI